MTLPLTAEELARLTTVREQAERDWPVVEKAVNGAIGLAYAHGMWTLDKTVEVASLIRDFGRLLDAYEALEKVAKAALRSMENAEAELKGEYGIRWPADDEGHDSVTWMETRDSLRALLA